MRINLKCLAVQWRGGDGQWTLIHFNYMYCRAWLMLNIFSDWKKKREINVDLVGVVCIRVWTHFLHRICIDLSIRFWLLLFDEYRAREWVFTVHEIRFKMHIRHFTFSFLHIYWLIIIYLLFRFVRSFVRLFVFSMHIGIVSLKIHEKKKTNQCAAALLARKCKCRPNIYIRFSFVVLVESWLCEMWSYTFGSGNSSGSSGGVLSHWTCVRISVYSPHNAHNERFLVGVFVSIGMMPMYTVWYTCNAVAWVDAPDSIII